MRITTYVFLGLIAVSQLNPVAAQETSLEQCQKLKNDIARYSALRRDGGSGAQMDAWKQRRRELEKQFRQLRCKQYRWQMR